MGVESLLQETTIEVAEDYLQKPFMPLIERYGGKNAGNELLKKFHAENQEPIQGIAQEGGFVSSVIPPTIYIETDVFDEFERLQPDWLTWIKEAKERRDRVDSLGNAGELAAALIEESDEAKQFFSELLGRLQAETRISRGLFVRGSLTSEDFLNEELTGVSKSELLFPVRSRFTPPPAIKTLCNMYMHTLLGKLDGRTEYTELGSEDKLGLQLAPAIGGEFHVTSHAYEDGSVKLQVQSFRALRTNKPMWFVYEISANDEVNVYPNFSPNARSADWVTTNCCHQQVNGVACFLNEQQALCLAKLARLKKETIGFDQVDCETIISSNVLVDVQVRPALHSLGEDYEMPSEDRIIARTPFVLGRPFRAKGKLVFAKSALNVEIGLELGTREYDPKDHIMVVSGRDEFIHAHSKMRFHKGTLFAGYVGYDYGSELSHMTSGDKEGQTYFMRRFVNYLSDPHLQERLQQAPITWDELSTHTGNPLPVSRETFILQAGEKGGVLAFAE